MPVRVFIIEDHEVMREMLAEFLADAPDLDVCGVAPTGAEALNHLPEARADLVLVDVSLPEMNGIDLVEELQQRYPEMPCLMISGHGEANYVQRALSAGARGYLMKGDPSEIIEAIHEVSRGGTYLSKPLRLSSSGGSPQ